MIRALILSGRALVAWLAALIVLLGVLLGFVLGRTVGDRLFFAATIPLTNPYAVTPGALVFAGIGGFVAFLFAASGLGMVAAIFDMHRLLERIAANGSQPRSLEEQERPRREPRL